MGEGRGARERVVRGNSVLDHITASGYWLLAYGSYAVDLGSFILVLIQYILFWWISLKQVNVFV